MEAILEGLTGLCVGLAVFFVACGGVGSDRPRRVLPRCARPLAKDAVVAWLEALGHRVVLIRLGNLAPVAAFSERLTPVLKEHGLAVSRRGCVACAVVVTAAAMALCVLVSGSLVGALVGALAAASTFAALVGRRERRLRDSAAEQMPEVLRCLSSALGAGRSLSQAIEYAGANLAEPMGSEFLRASFQIASGVPVEEAIASLCARTSAPGINLVGAALQISQRTGSALCGLFERTARMVGETVALRRELQVKTSQARLSAKVVSGMPVMLACILALLSPDYRAGLAVPTGRLCLCAAALLDVAALGLIRHIMRGSTP